jgi:signal transduction histidine kinase
MGMSPETRRRLFEPFFTTKSATGTGLGLWVSSEILSNHHARVRVRSWQSAERHGTVFSIFFPLNAAKG